MVTALVAILVMLALPNYRAPVVRVERVAAGVCLLEVATRIEAQRAAQQPVTTPFALYTEEGGCEVTLADRYLFTVTTETDWHIAAELLEVSSADSEACRRLVITRQGQRGVKLADGTLDFSDAALDCW